MFSYLRYFFITSLILLVGTTAFLSWYHSTSSDEIILNQTQKSNIAIAKAYSNTIWFKHKDIIKVIYEYAPDERSEYKEFVEFARESAHYLQDMPIVKFNLYGPDGSLFYSTNQGTINITENYDVTPVQGETSDLLTPEIASRSASVLSEIVFDARYVDVAGRNKQGNLVRTLVPIYSEEYVGIIADQTPQSDAVLEIYYDVNATTLTLDNFQYTATGFIVVIFLILYAILFITTRRAEGIIERQHETNVELSNAKVKAEASNEQKSQFLANISHELRTPLNAIIGFSEIIKDEVMGELGNEQYKNYVRDIHSSGVHLLSLINDILDYSKAEAGKLEMEYEMIDLNKLVMACLRLQEPRAQSGEIKLTKQLPSEHITIKTDTKRLKQVLLNLLSNAVKFTPPNGEVSISAWLNVTDGKIGIQVKDTGIGIAPKDIAKALSPFGQVDSDLSRRYEGTGLGLPLTKKFVELLGGKLQLESEEGKGTQITIFLPKDADIDSVENQIAGQKANIDSEQHDNPESTEEIESKGGNKDKEPKKKGFKISLGRKSKVENTEENEGANSEEDKSSEDSNKLTPQDKPADAPKAEAKIATDKPAQQPQSQMPSQGAPAGPPPMQNIPSMQQERPKQPIQQQTKPQAQMQKQPEKPQPMQTKQDSSQPIQQQPNIKPAQPQGNPQMQSNPQPMQQAEPKQPSPNNPQPLTQPLQNKPQQPVQQPQIKPMQGPSTSQSENPKPAGMQPDIQPLQQPSQPNSNNLNSGQNKPSSQPLQPNGNNPTPTLNTNSQANDKPQQNPTPQGQPIKPLQTGQDKTGDTVAPKNPDIPVFKTSDDKPDSKPDTQQ